jgi:hypothetical protein
MGAASPSRNDPVDFRLGSLRFGTPILQCATRCFGDPVKVIAQRAW